MYWFRLKVYADDKSIIQLELLRSFSSDNVPRNTMHIQYTSLKLQYLMEPTFFSLSDIVKSALLQKTNKRLQ